MCSQALWRRIWPILLTITGCRCCSSGASHQLAEHTLRCNGFTRIRKDAVAQMGSRPPTVTMTFIGCKFGFWKCFGASSWSSHWAGCCWLLYKIHFSLHITIWLRDGSLLLCTVREDDTSKWCFFDWWSVHEASTYQTFSTFQCASKAEWL